MLCLALFGLKKLAGHRAYASLALPANSAALKTQTQAPTVAAQSADSTKHDLGAYSLDLYSSFRNYPQADTFTYEGRTLAAQYDPDSLLNARTAVYLQRYRPETGVILACDLKSGRVLAAGERQDSVVTTAPRMAFLGCYPAASLIKILTASAAFDLKGKDATDSIPVIGGYYTLYKRQLRCGESWDRLPKITIREAFAKSVNPAFAVLGQSMGPEVLRTVAEKLGFNHPRMPQCGSPSRIDIPDSGFGLAEMSCGFTGKTTISPWHALEIARGAGDDGRLRACSFARSVTDIAGNKQVTLAGDTGTQFISPANLPKLQTLMEGTIRFGTARKSFYSVLRASHMEKLDLGGKTGSLDGDEPKGRYDWFIGYAKLKDDPSDGLALAIMVVHREYVSVRSSQLAALLIRDWIIAKEKAKKAKTSMASSSHSTSAGA
jgi:peptidoglycan glycosyltransferase